MDNVCHTLVGAAIGEAGLKRRTAFGAAALLISANVPDLDVLVFATDTPAVAFRRGITHGIAAQLVLPVLLTAVFMAAGKIRPRAGNGDPPLRPGWLLVLSLTGVYSHVGLDWLNSYGERLLTPFSWRWFYGDSLFIVDPWLWLVLGAGVWLTRRSHARAVAESIRGSSSTMPARGALALAGCYIVAMIVSARAAHGIVERAWRESHGVSPVALMVGPVPVTPFRRDVIVDAGDHYETGTFSWWGTSLTMDPEPIAKNADRPQVASARASSDGVRAFLVWSRFPYWTVRADTGGTRVTVADMRFPGGGRFAETTLVPDN